jgi:hypothetical protein
LPEANGMFSIKENSSPIKVFRILVDNDIFKIMQEETNLYTAQQIKVL